MTCLVYPFTRQLVTIKTNDFVKPKDQREFIRFGLARNRTFKKVLRDAFASLQKYIITKIPQKLFVEYLCRQFPARVTHFFLRNPFNYTLVGLTICCIVGCVCMVCVLNPTLMTGLSCPEMGGSSLI